MRKKRLKEPKSDSKVEGADMREFNFSSLVGAINCIHKELSRQTNRAINMGLTIRNWCIGCYIAGYELKGADRADYGELLVDLDDDTKREFYELEAIRGSWSVRELKRQISSLYYERSGLSLDKEKLAEITMKAAAQSGSALSLRDPYIFEFLGLKPRDVMSESQLEDELLDKIEGFLLELGHGFCFEARQKRVLIGESLYYIDLVFYHRILKCHVLVELKLAEFNHQNIGQLNTYVSWYKKNIMTDGDNPPIGILLCTEKDHTLVEYALAGMDENLFVSKYQLELPKKEEMEKFIEKKLWGAIETE